MPGGRSCFSEICVNPQPDGLRAVYLVETSSADEAKAVSELFADLESRLQVRQLCSGKLMSYVVQAQQTDCSLLDEIEEMLKGQYSFIVTQRSFDQMIYRIVAELCADTSSRLLCIPHCNICGRAEPFPSVLVSLCDEQGKVKTCRNYCASCAAEATATSNKEFVRSLLASDKRRFREIERAELVRRPSRRQPMKYKIKVSV